MYLSIKGYSSCYELLQVLFYDSTAAAHDKHDGFSVSHSVRYIIRPTIFLNNFVWSRYVYVYAWIIRMRMVTIYKSD